MSRPKPPELYFPYPDCSVCGTETDGDGDSFWCGDCGITWPGNGEGVWSEEKAEQCPSTHQPYARNRHVKDRRYRTERCVLDVDHDPEHRSDEFTTWTDESAVNGVTEAAGMAP